MDKDNSENNKQKLVIEINKVSRNLDVVIKITGEFLEQATLQKSIAKSAKEIVNQIPDDSYVGADEWTREIQRWNNVDKGICGIIGYGATIPFANTASLASGTSGYGFPGKFIRNMPSENQIRIDQEILNINKVIESIKWDESIESEFIRLHIENGKPGKKSSLSLLQSAHSALLKLNTANPNATSVLIPARESIHRSLADIIPRRPHQESAHSIKDKVFSICKQLAYDHIMEEDIDQLAADAAELVVLLSEGKQGNISELQIRALFNRTKIFLKALLSSIDEKKMR